MEELTQVVMGFTSKLPSDSPQNTSKRRVSSNGTEMYAKAEILIGLEF